LDLLEECLLYHVTSFLIIKVPCWAGGVAQAIEHLPRKYEGEFKFHYHQKEKKKVCYVGENVEHDKSYQE
jgi:hypothetical protein